MENEYYFTFCKNCIRFPYNPIDSKDVDKHQTYEHKYKRMCIYKIKGRDCIIKAGALV
jgi:hypothetical protein